MKQHENLLFILIGLLYSCAIFEVVEFRLYQQSLKFRPGFEIFAGQWTYVASWLQ